MKNSFEQMVKKQGRISYEPTTTDDFEVRAMVSIPLKQLLAIQQATERNTLTYISDMFGLPADEVIKVAEQRKEK